MEASTKIQTFWGALLLVSGCANFDAQSSYLMLLNNSFSSSASTTAWWDRSFASRRKLTMDNSAATSSISNFPVLVSLSSTNIDYTKTQNSGQDLRFIDSDDATVLSHEIENWNESGTSTVWVQIPLIDTGSSDYFYMYYNNASATDAQSASAVWDSSHQIVLHLNETVTDEASGGTHSDATANGNSGTQQGNGPVAGNSAQAQEFDGANDYISTAYASNNLSGNLTWSLMFYSDDAGTIGSDSVAQRFMTMYRAAASSRLSYGLNNNRLSVIYYQGAHTTVDATTVILPSTWYHAALTYNGANIQLYLNGASDLAINPGALTAPAGQSMNYATHDTTARMFDGRLDEIRISNTVRSADWILAEAKSEQGTFLTFSSEENL